MAVVYEEESRCLNVEMVSRFIHFQDCVVCLLRKVVVALDAHLGRQYGIYGLLQRNVTRTLRDWVILGLSNLALNLNEYTQVGLLLCSPPMIFPMVFLPVFQSVLLSIFLRIFLSIFLNTVQLG